MIWKFAMMGLSAVLMFTFCWGQQEEGLVGHWDFDEGKGNVLHDRSGNENHGKIHGATWVKRGQGYALSFDGVDDYVDCGSSTSLDLTKSVTIEAWVKPAALPLAEPMIVGKHFDSFAITMYKDGNCWFYISSGGNNVKGRVEVNSWSHIAATFDGSIMTLYINAKKVASKKSKFDQIRRGKNLLMGAFLGPGYYDPCYWRGVLDDVRIYNRALSEEEVINHYKQKAGEYGVDTAMFDRIGIVLYPFRAEKRLLALVDFSGLLPRPKDAALEVSLFLKGSAEPLQKQEFKNLPSAGKLCVSFRMTDLPQGDYMVRCNLTSTNRPVITAEQEFRHPPEALKIPSPTKQKVAPLPPSPKLAKFGIELSAGGGFFLSIKGRRFPIESSFSYPHGGENWLVAGEQDSKGEPGWQVTTRKVSKNTFEVVGKGRYYTVTRHIRLYPNRINIQDTIRNDTSEDLGIIIDNYLDATQEPFSNWAVAGYPYAVEQEGSASPSTFVAWKDFGVGMLPLDDVFVVQSKVYAKDNRAGLSTNKFGLAPKASYTLEWAIYPLDVPDYYEFINSVRRDENRNRMTVEGGFAFIPRHATSLEQDYVRLRNLTYASLGCLTNVADDPEIEIEGIEFLWLPKERERLRSQFESIRKEHPNLKLMFHIAHSLIATNKPSEMFPDSRVIDANGNHAIYPYDYEGAVGVYFSRQRLDEGWRWYIYYPTPGNSFHDALMKSVDVLIDEIGCSGAFMDGFLWGYGGAYTYDRWDGHTVEIDLKTKTIKRKVGSVLLLSQPSMVEFARRMNAKGAVIIANNVVVTRTIGSLPLIVDQEIRSGPDVHLAQTPCALGDPSRIKDEVSLYEDVLDKLKWGNLYFYYGEPTLTYPSLPKQMYPITVEEIRSGIIKGKERIITMQSGVYGWSGSVDLHFCYRYNPVGMEVPAEFLTTVDAAGVRTQVQLEPGESAVVKKVPLILRATQPVNLVFERYDDSAIVLSMNGKGKVELHVKSGDFPIKPGAHYRVSTSAKPIAADRNGILKVPITLKGQTQVSIEPLSTVN